MALFLYALTLPNINRFSKLFHCQNQEKICNNTITKDPITREVCRYTTLWNTTCLLYPLLSKVTVTSCSCYIKCSMCPPCCWTTHSSRRRQWPMARSMKRCDNLPTQWRSLASAAWLSWIVDVDRPSVEDTRTVRNTWRTCSMRTSRSSSLTCDPQTARTWIQSITLFGVPWTFL